MSLFSSVRGTMMNSSIRQFLSPGISSCTALITALIIAQMAINCSAEIVDRVLAQVNNDVITLSEVEEASRPLYRNILAEVPSDKREEALRQLQSSVVDKLIDDHLVSQEAAKQNITVTDSELQAAYTQVMKRNNMTADEFKDELAKNNFTEDSYLKNLRNQILKSKLISRNVNSKIVISDAEILDYYDTHYAARVDQGDYYLLQIGTTWNKEGDKEAARKKIESLHKRAVAGEDFEKLAKQFSELPSAADSGDIGAFMKDEMPESMQEALAGLGAGDISPIVETSSGFQFFKLLSGDEGGYVMKAPYDDVKENIRETLYQQAIDDSYQSWIKSIRERAYIKKL